MRECTLSIRNNPKRYSIWKVSGSEHIDHKSNIKLLPHTGKVLALCLIVRIIPCEMSYHNSKKSIESTTYDTRSCWKNKQSDLTDRWILLNFDEFFKNCEDKEISN